MGSGKPEGRTASGRGAEDDRWAVLSEEGIETTRLRSLVETLDDEFDVASMGYAQLTTIANEYERAVVSDLIGRSAQGITDNLLDARLAEHALAELDGPDGVAMPTKESGRGHIRRGAWADIHLSTFVGALESGFDCLAAVAIGVLRIPMPIKEAQLSQFKKNLPTLKPPSSKLDRAWCEWGQLLQHHRGSQPAGWNEWLNGMRNLFVHRARQNRVLLQRTRAPDQPQLIVVTENPAEVNQRYARFDRHLRARPRLTDMEDYVLAARTSDLWLPEPAPVTLAGVFNAANAFVEEAAHFLLVWWQRAETWSSTFFPPPKKAWRPAASLGDSYAGSAPLADGFQPATGHGYPTLEKRLAVARKLRSSRSLPGARET